MSTTTEETLSPSEVRWKMDYCMSALVYYLGHKIYTSDFEKRVRDPELTNENIRYIIQFLPNSSLFPCFCAGEEKTNDNFVELWNKVMTLHSQGILYANSRTQKQIKDIEDIIIKIGDVELGGYKPWAYKLSPAEQEKLIDAESWLLDRKIILKRRGNSEGGSA